MFLMSIGSWRVMPASPAAFYAGSRDSFCQEEKAAAGKPGVDVYGLMEKQARKSPIGSSGVTALMGPRIMNARLLMAPFEPDSLWPFQVHGGRSG